MACSFLLRLLVQSYRLPASGENDAPLPRRKRKLNSDDSLGNNHFFYFPEPLFLAAPSDDAYNLSGPQSGRQTGADRVPRKSSSMAKWDLHTEEVLVRICHDYHIQGQLLSTTFTETTWKEIQAKLLLETQNFYEVLQLKSKFCLLRQNWRKLKKIMNSKTGDDLCWDPLTRTLTAPNEFWDQWLAEHPNDASYRHKQFPCFDLCSELFSSSVATGENATMSRDRTLSCQDGDGTSMQLVHHEGKEPTNFRTSSYNSKGHIGDGIPSSTDGAKNLPLKKTRGIHVSKVDSAIYSLSSVNSARADHLPPHKEKGNKICKVTACIEVLNKMDGILTHLYLKACDDLMVPDRREIFLAWPDDKRQLWVESLSTL